MSVTASCSVVERVVTWSRDGSGSGQHFASVATRQGSYTNPEKEGCLRQTSVKCAIAEYSNRLQIFLTKIKHGSAQQQLSSLDESLKIIRSAWDLCLGKDVALHLCLQVREDGILECLVERLDASQTTEMQLAAARFLEQVLIKDNVEYIVTRMGMDSLLKFVVEVNGSDLARQQVNAGILESLLKESERTCLQIIKLGGLQSLIELCRSTDIGTQRHCAIALGNLAIYGGEEGLKAMIQMKAPDWLFPLAFSPDDTVRYYACLTSVYLVGSPICESAAAESGTLELILPFLAKHSPEDFGQQEFGHKQGRSKEWLRRLVSLLDSRRPEARALAAFHFAMEAHIKLNQDRLEEFHAINAVEALKRLAGSPDDTASKYAAEALRIIGEEIPHKLSQSVPLWTVDDVVYWVKQIGFPEFASEFEASRVDGDLLLRLDYNNMAEDLNMKNGIQRKRFMRRLRDLKIQADLTAVDPTRLDLWLMTATAGIDSRLTQYSYQMLDAGVDTKSLHLLTDSILDHDCGIKNGLHRALMLHAIEKSVHSVDLGSTLVEAPVKTLDVFISYRRSSGSQLASLLKVHLQLRGFRVFIDVERLSAGMFNDKILEHIRAARHFVLVLTPNALDRCIGDSENKDWIHREVTCAIGASCNIIPVSDNFLWPVADELPEDMRVIAQFNGVRWIHDYQEACVEKLEKFLRSNAIRLHELQ